MTQILDAGRMIRTVSGRYVDVFDPKPEMFVLSDIAHALSHLCRYGGHVPKFYSVAEHSFHCMERMISTSGWDQWAIEALMHDATEAYLVDLPRPIKREISQYKEIEDKLATVIAQRFRTTFLDSKPVKHIDQEILQWEWDTFVTVDSDFIPLRPNQAKAAFIGAFIGLAKDAGTYEILEKEGALG